MITIQNKIPRKVCVACSGGVDSVVAVDFLSRNHEVTIAHVNHGTETADKAEEYVHDIAERYGCDIITYRITERRPSNQSQEEFWRNERYKFFHSIPQSVVTCHHLNDCVETWVWSSMHGEGKIIPYDNRNVIRPFRLTPKTEFYSWAERNKLGWVEDNSNSDTSYTRNYIRHTMMPHVLRVNPGIEKTIKKKILNG